MLDVCDQTPLVALTGLVLRATTDALQNFAPDLMRFQGATRFTLDVLVPLILSYSWTRECYFIKYLFNGTYKIVFVQSFNQLL